MNKLELFNDIVYTIVHKKDEYEILKNHPTYLHFKINACIFDFYLRYDNDKIFLTVPCFIYKNEPVKSLEIKSEKQLLFLTKTALDNYRFNHCNINITSYIEKILYQKASINNLISGISVYNDLVVSFFYKNRIYNICYICESFDVVNDKRPILLGAIYLEEYIRNHTYGNGLTFMKIDSKNFKTIRDFEKNILGALENEEYYL